MSKYEYCERVFTANSKQLINELIDKSIDKEILDFVTQLNKDGDQLFSFEELVKIRKGINYGHSLEQIKIYALIKDDRPVYDALQMDCIIEGIDKCLSPEELAIITRLDENMKPVYSAEYMDVIFVAFMNAFPIKEVENIVKLNKENIPIYDCVQAEQIFHGELDNVNKNVIDFYSALNSSGKPIYSGSRMRIIKLASKQKMPLDHIKIFAKCKDEKPLYLSSQMDVIRMAIVKASKANEIDRINQIKDCVNDCLSFNQLSPLLSDKLPIENMRVYRSLYRFGVSINDVNEMIKKNETYENLKEIKYLLTCNEKLGTKAKNIISSHSLDLEYKRNFLAKSLSVKFNVIDMESIELIDKLLSFKMPPEQIAFIIDQEYSFSSEEREKIAIGLLSGLTVQDIEDIVSYINDNYMGNTVDLLDEIIKETIKSQINESFNLDEDINLETFFDDCKMR